MKKLLLSGVLVLFFSYLFGQGKQNFSRINAGFGIGIDYGGIGGRLTVMPVKQLMLFGGAGFNFLELGYNFGGGIRVNTEKNFIPYILAMYGYNAVLIVKGASQNNKTYYGSSFGIGAEVREGVLEKKYFNFELLVPIRDKQFSDDMDRLENMGAIFSKKPLPIAISIGYHIGF